MNLKVSIVIPVYNEEKMLPLCLDSLMNLDYPKELLEIIIVDNNSTDLSASIIKKYPVKYLLEKRKGASAARNTGISQANGEIVAFTDADCVVDKDWIKNLVKGFKNANTGCCAGKTISYKPDTLIEKLFEWLFEDQPKWGINHFEDYFVGRVFATCNLACRKKFIDEIGAFDETLLASEDVDLVWRINLKGYQINYLDDPVVSHKRRQAFRELPEVFIKYMYWQYYLIKKYENIIGISIDWLRVSGKIARSLVYSAGCLFKLSLKESLFYFTIAVLSLMQIFTAVYMLIETKLARKNKMTVLNFVPENILWRWDNSDVMIVNLEKKFGYTLSGAGARIWELLQLHKKESEIINDMKEEYAIEETEARKDLAELMNEFESEGLLANHI